MIFQLIVTVDSLITRADAPVINSSTVTTNWKSLNNRFYYIIKSKNPRFQHEQIMKHTTLKDNPYTAIHPVRIKGLSQAEHDPTSMRRTQ